MVVDGSNLATEGRTSPSLRQLDEAVRAYAAEDPLAEIVVVVDASFEHRIDPSERAQLHEAELHGEIVSPPAGAIGRGDAFVLRIAERTGARVLSNDSFQEFHAQHPWLFDEGRLVGGKPVPGIGWIFTPRLPVRGPKSKEVTGKAKRASEALPAPVKAAELAKAARKAAKKAAAHLIASRGVAAPAGAAVRKGPSPVLPDGSTPRVGDVWRPSGPPARDGSEVPAARSAKASVKKGAAKVQAEKKGADKKPAGKAADPTKSDATKQKEARKRSAKTEEAGPSGKGAPRAKRPAADVAGTDAAAPVSEAEGAARRSSDGARPEATPGAAGRPKKKGKTDQATAPPEGAAMKVERARVAAAKARGGSKKQVAGPLPAEKTAHEKQTAKKSEKKQSPKAEGAKKAAATKQTKPRPELQSAKRAKKQPATEVSARAQQAKKRGPKASEAPAGAPVSSETDDAHRAAASGRARGREDPAVRRAIDEAVAEAVSVPDAEAVEGTADGGRGRAARKGRDGEGGAETRSPKRRRARASAPPPAVNEPLAFITFVASYPLYSEVEGEVVSFTSHGAMVDVELPGGGTLHSYIPLSAMGDPPPTKARQVLSRGERRPFVLVGLDPPRRVAELALPGAVPAASPAG